MKGSEQISKYVENLAKLGFGITLGSGLGGFIYILLSSVGITSDIEPTIFMSTFGFIGLGLSQVISRVVNWVFKPLLDFLGFYFKVGQLFYLKRTGMFPLDKIEEVSSKLLNQYFLGEILNDTLEKSQPIGLLESTKSSKEGIDLEDGLKQEKNKSKKEDTR